MDDGSNGRGRDDAVEGGEKEGTRSRGKERKEK